MSDEAKYRPDAGYWLAFRCGELVPIAVPYGEGEDYDAWNKRLRFSLLMEAGDPIGPFGFRAYSASNVADGEPPYWRVTVSTVDAECEIEARGWADFLGLMRWLAPLASAGLLEKMLDMASSTRETLAPGTKWQTGTAGLK